jgi:uncharacterized circularly permuted ATP-grasp superfamily protein
VPTWQLKKPKDLAEVMDNLPKLVVKEVQGSGGYGMLIGPTSTKKEIEAFRARILANPANYIAQPTLSLSTCPTFVEQGLNYQVEAWFAVIAPKGLPAAEVRQPGQG